MVAPYFADRSPQPGMPDDRWDQRVPASFIPDTNSIEAVNRQLRKIIKNRGHFPTEDSALKLLWLALMRAEQKWTYPIKEWQLALHEFAIYFPAKVNADID
jgi:putative transposase